MLLRRDEDQVTMDLLEYLEDYCVVVCRSCATGVVPRHLATHLWTHHRHSHDSFRTRPATERWVQDSFLPSLPGVPLDPYHAPVVLPPSDSEPLPLLKVYRGFGCSYCDYVRKNEGQMRQHYNVSHAPIRRGRGGSKANATGLLRERLDREHYGKQPPWTPVNYQRFFALVGTANPLFRVKRKGERNPETEGPSSHFSVDLADRGALISDQVFAELADLESARAENPNLVSNHQAKTQVSPWLERTRWTRYLEKHPLAEVARLSAPPDQVREPVLIEMAKAIDRLVSVAYASVCEDRVNFFGQNRITCFLPQKEVYSRPLVYKLQQSTYQQYKQLWKRALAFVLRTHDPRTRIQLQHRLNSRQTALLDSVVDLAKKQAAQPLTATEPLDKACLDLCIALLDHHLPGNIYESAIVGFLAVLGVDEANGSFFEAPSYTPKLSAFIKIAQLLVLQKAVYAVEDGLAEDSLTPLDEMRKRFMTLNNNTAFTWAVSLRSFGKRIRDCTTSMGYIQWSEDAQTVFYRDFEISISGFRDFVCDQVKKGQSQLESLFLLSVDEERREVVPPILLDRIRDNPTVTLTGWNFLKDKRNQDTLPSHEKWLLQRVLSTERLRDQFCSLDCHGKVSWNRKTIDEFQRKTVAFLETLLLLVHVTSGQPARGTEIIGVQHTNTSFHRNIFVEEGLVTIVTSYHKGYTCTGSTKIIHRYLPREVSELFIYYMWLVLPFTEKLDMLQAGRGRTGRTEGMPAIRCEAQYHSGPLSLLTECRASRLSNLAFPVA